MSALTRDEKLVKLMEECGEVIQAASKCLLFGYDRFYPGYGVNHEVLAREFGDLLGIADSLGLSQSSIDDARSTKMARAENAKEQFGRISHEAMT